jgi:hypothetical protein
MKHLLFLLFFFIPFLRMGWIQFEAFMANDLRG